MTNVRSCNDIIMVDIRMLRLWSVREWYDHEVFTIWYDYDMTCEWRIYIYILWYDMKMIWNKLWSEMCDNWHVFYMIYCDWICYGMICTWWTLFCLEAWNVIIWYIYVISMIWCDWHVKRRTSMKYNSNVCIKDMINDMWNDMRNGMICMER